MRLHSWYCIEARVFTLGVPLEHRTFCQRNVLVLRQPPSTLTYRSDVL